MRPRASDLTDVQRALERFHPDWNSQLCAGGGSETPRRTIRRPPVDRHRR